MNRAGDQLLAGAGFADEQHGAVETRDQLQALLHVAHGRARANQVLEMKGRPVRCQGFIGFRFARRDRRPQAARQLRHRERFRQEVDGALLDRHHGFRNAARAGHDHRSDVRIPVQCRIEQIHAVAVRERQVEDETVVGKSFQA